MSMGWENLFLSAYVCVFVSLPLSGLTCFANRGNTEVSYLVSWCFEPSQPLGIYVTAVISKGLIIVKCCV